MEQKEIYITENITGVKNWHNEAINLSKAVNIFLLLIFMFINFIY